MKWSHDSSSKVGAYAYAHIVTILCEYNLGLGRHVQKYLIQLSCIKIVFTGIIVLDIKTIFIEYNWILQYCLEML